MNETSAAVAQAAAIATQKVPGAPQRRKIVAGINVGPYAGFRVPGIDRTKIFSEPWRMLKNGDATKTYYWCKPDQSETRSMVERGIMRPVRGEEVDTASRFAAIELKRILTSDGPKRVVRTPGGLGLYEVMDQAGMRFDDLADLSGRATKPTEEPDHWQKAYLAELAGQQDKFEEDIEMVSDNQLGVRVSGEMTTRDANSREPVV